MTLYLSLLLRFYSNTFLAQHSRTTNISMNFIKLASITGARNLLSITPSTLLLLPASKTELLSRSFKTRLLVASSISFTSPKMLQQSHPESFSCLAAPLVQVPVGHSKRLQSCSRHRLWPCCSWGDCPSPPRARGNRVSYFLTLCDLFQIRSLLCDCSARRAGCGDRAGPLCGQSSAFAGDPELAGRARAAGLGFGAERLQQGMHKRSARE